MSQSLANLAVHIVFSTKNRQPWLKDQDLRRELYAFMATVYKEKVDSPAMVINGVGDHVHALCMLSRKFAVMDVVREVKTATSRWMKKQAPRNDRFTWQAGYGAFSVSESNINQVKQYIHAQEQHHRRMTFQDEFRELCRRHGIEWDERYAWD